MIWSTTSCCSTFKRKRLLIFSRVAEMKAFLQVTQAMIEWSQMMIRIASHVDCNQSWFLFMNLSLKSINICMKLSSWFNLHRFSSSSWRKFWFCSISLCFKDLISESVLIISSIILNESRKWSWLIMQTT